MYILHMLSKILSADICFEIEFMIGQGRTIFV